MENDRELRSDLAADLLIARAEIETLRRENEKLKAERVAVVRCKDCKNSDVERTEDGLIWCYHFCDAMLDYEYCSCGERKEVTGNG